MFTDRARILIKSGDGGNGAISFHREKYINAGGPDGGDGGKGGNVIFIAKNGMSTLTDFRFKRKFAAMNGENGAKNKMTGKDGQSIVIEVPVGTVVKDFATGELLADMIEPDEKRIILKGGRGGKGNCHFATPTRQIPNFARAGEEGRQTEVTLELKLLADVGLIGFPNVGKSTLLSVTTAAKPEIADYHFTTLTPVLGVVYNEYERSFVMADIPGLIEGASEGVGLGHEFLRHVERTRLLLHVIDISGKEGRDPFNDFIAINKELKLYNDVLAIRPQMIVLNKSDYDDNDTNTNVFKEKYNAWLDENRDNLQESIDAGAWKCFSISAYTGKGVRELMLYTGSIIDSMPRTILQQQYDSTVEEKQYSADEDKLFDISVDEDGVYTVEGPWIKRIINSISSEDYESTGYFQRLMKKKGLFEELEKMGIKEHDTVRIYTMEFEYMK